MTIQRLNSFGFYFSCMPQRESETVDRRTSAELDEFQNMLSAIADLYLTSRVLILLDNTYKTRFWTTTEAWCAMQTATVHGVQTSTESECRYSIACIHIAIKEYAEPELVTTLSRRTPREMHTFLASTDIAVTNLKDKEQMLPIVMRTNEHVQDMLKFSKRFVNQQQDQKEEDGIQQSVQEKEAHNESKSQTK